MSKIYILFTVILGVSHAMETPMRNLSLELLKAVHENDVNCIEKLLAAGADPAIQDEKEKNTPLIIATLKESLPSVKALLKKMTPTMVNMANGEGVPALHHAAYYGYHHIVTELIGAGADIDYQIDMSKLPKDGFNTPSYPTALMIAIENWKDKTAQVLLNAGANPNIEGPDGMTALLIAPDEGMDPKVMQLLLARGANVKKKNAWGETALYGLVTGQEIGSTCDNIEALVQAGADVNELFENGNNVLQLVFIKAAANKDNPTYSDYWPSNDMVQILIKVGINVHHRNFEGKTALDLVRPYEKEFLNQYIIPMLEKAEKEQRP